MKVKVFRSRPSTRHRPSQTPPPSPQPFHPTIPSTPVRPQWVGARNDSGPVPSVPPTRLQRWSTTGLSNRCGCPGRSCRLVGGVGGRLGARWYEGSRAMPRRVHPIRVNGVSVWCGCCSGGSVRWRLGVGVGVGVLVLVFLSVL